MKQIRCQSGKIRKLQRLPKKIVKFMRPSPNSFYNCHNPTGIKYIARIWLGLSKSLKKA